MRCISPMSVPRPNGAGNFDRITVPCGKCLACLSTKRSQWVLRITEELKRAYSAYFVTLTYNDEHLPVTPDGEISLFKDDLQDFLKRLRITIERKAKSLQIEENRPKIKYFAVGEYGGVSERPHYHCIIFNLPLLHAPEFLQVAWSKNGVPIGHVHVGTVNVKSISYTAKYCINEISNSLSKQNTFSLVSKGIGENYVSRMADFHRSTGEFNAIQNGERKSMPRYYRDKIFTKLEKKNHAKIVIKEFDEKEEERINKELKKGESVFLKELETKKQLLKSIKNKKSSNEKI